VVAQSSNPSAGKKKMKKNICLGKHALHVYLQLEKKSGGNFPHMIL
jgi:hypothetical protein